MILPDVNILVYKGVESEKNMTYTEAGKRAVIKYEKERMKRIVLKYTIDDYENIISPAVKESGLPTATYIKQAVMEKIERDQNRK